MPGYEGMGMSGYDGMSGSYEGMPVYGEGSMPVYYEGMSGRLVTET